MTRHQGRQSHPGHTRAELRSLAYLGHGFQEACAEPVPQRRYAARLRNVVDELAHVLVQQHEGRVRKRCRLRVEQHRVRVPPCAGRVRAARWQRGGGP